MASVHPILLVIFLSFTYSLADEPSGNYCNQNTVISSGSPVSANINDLLTAIVRGAETNAVYIENWKGKGTNKVYGLTQCRGDVGTKDCKSCIEDAAQQVRKLCPNQADARIWYDHCFLRYSQDQFYGKLDTTIGTLYANVQNVTNPDFFNQELGTLFNEIDSEAVKPENTGLWQDKKKLSDSETLYGLVQCTRDLSPTNCAQCLAKAIQNFQGFCHDKQGCRVLYSSCYVRYELYPFSFPLDSSSRSPLSPSPSPSLSEP